MQRSEIKYQDEFRWKSRQIQQKLISPKRPLFKGKLAWLWALFFAPSRKSSIPKLSTLKLVSSQAPQIFLQARSLLQPSPRNFFWNPLKRQKNLLSFLLSSFFSHKSSPAPYYHHAVFATCPMRLAPSRKRSPHFQKWKNFNSQVVCKRGLQILINK